VYVCVCVRARGWEDGGGGKETDRWRQPEEYSRRLAVICSDSPTSSSVPLSRTFRRFICSCDRSRSRGIAAASPCTPLSHTDARKSPSFTLARVRIVAAHTARMWHVHEGLLLLLLPPFPSLPPSLPPSLLPPSGVRETRGCSLAARCRSPCAPIKLSRCVPLATDVPLDAR